VLGFSTSGGRSAGGSAVGVTSAEAEVGMAESVVVVGDESPSSSSLFPSLSSPMTLEKSRGERRDAAAA